VLQCVAVGHSVLQSVTVRQREDMHVAVCCSVLQCVSACCRGVGTPRVSKCKCVAVYGSGLQCLVVCCSVLQRGENSVSQSVQVCCSIWQRVVAYGSVLQCVAVCCSVF